MNWIEKIAFALCCYAESAILNLTVLGLGILDGPQTCAWVAFNIWLWCFAPPIVLIAMRKEERS